MRTNCISMAEDFNLSLERFFAPNKEKLENMVSKLEKMEKSLDAYLDKPLDENNVHYACGNALEEIMGQLKDLKNQMIDNIVKIRADIDQRTALELNPMINNELIDEIIKRTKEENELILLEGDQQQFNNEENKQNKEEEDVNG